MATYEEGLDPSWASDDTNSLLTTLVPPSQVYIAQQKSILKKLCGNLRILTRIDPTDVAHYSTGFSELEQKPETSSCGLGSCKPMVPYFFGATDLSSRRGQSRFDSDPYSRLGKYGQACTLYDLVRLDEHEKTNQNFNNHLEGASSNLAWNPNTKFSVNRTRNKRKNDIPEYLNYLSDMNDSAEENDPLKHHPAFETEPDIEGKKAHTKSLQEGSSPSIRSESRSQKRSILSWSIEEVGLWLKCIGRPQWVHLFSTEKISGTALLHLTDTDLYKFGLPIGEQVYLRQQLETLKKSFEQGTSGVSSSPITRRPVSTYPPSTQSIGSLSGIAITPVKKQNQSHPFRELFNQQMSALPIPDLDTEEYCEPEPEPPQPLSIENTEQQPQATKKKRKRKKKKKTTTEPAPTTEQTESQTLNPEPAPPSQIVVHEEEKIKQKPKKSKSPDIWNLGEMEERQRIKDFWLSLSEQERSTLIKLEKEAVLKKMKEQQRHMCSCSVCGRRRNAIEEELEMLYDAYYEELERYAEKEGNALTLGSSGMLNVADDLMKNEGKKFLDMMEKLAERRMKRQHDISIEENLDEKDQGSEEEGMTEEQRLEEGKRMFQMFAAKMFEQRVLTAYREKVAAEKQQKLIEEEEKREQQEILKKETRQRKRENKKAKKRQLNELKAQEEETVLPLRKELLPPEPKPEIIKETKPEIPLEQRSRPEYPKKVEVTEAEKVLQLKKEMERSLLEAQKLEEEKEERRIELSKKKERERELQKEQRIANRKQELEIEKDREEKARQHAIAERLKDKERKEREEQSRQARIRSLMEEQKKRDLRESENQRAIQQIEDKKRLERLQQQETQKDHPHLTPVQSAIQKRIAQKKTIVEESQHTEEVPEVPWGFVSPRLPLFDQGFTGSTQLNPQILNNPDLNLNDISPTLLYEPKPPPVEAPIPVPTISQPALPVHIPQASYGHTSFFLPNQDAAIPQLQDQIRAAHTYVPPNSFSQHPVAQYVPRQTFAQPSYPGPSGYPAAVPEQFYHQNMPYSVQPAYPAVHPRVESDIKSLQQLSMLSVLQARQSSQTPQREAKPFPTKEHEEEDDLFKLLKDATDPAKLGFDDSFLVYPQERRTWEWS